MIDLELQRVIDGIEFLRETLEEVAIAQQAAEVLPPLAPIDASSDVLPPGPPPLVRESRIRDPQLPRRRWHQPQPEQ